MHMQGHNKSQSASTMWINTNATKVIPPQILSDLYFKLLKPGSEMSMKSLAKILMLEKS